MGILSRTPPNFFATPFGLTGLAGTWLALSHTANAPRALSAALYVLAAAVWLVLLAGYLARVTATRGRLMADLQDPVLSPFVSVIPIVAMQLGVGLHPDAPRTAMVIVDIALVVVIGLGGWLTGQWMTGNLDQDKFHPGYLLPTVAGGLLASTAATTVGQPGLGRVCFGIGIVCWLVIGSLMLQRLFFRPPLPTPLVPTMAIEVAPAPVAGLAWFALTPVPDTLAYGLAGYTILMVLAQIRLIPVYLRTPFTPGYWAFTFSYAAVATLAIRWLTVERPPAHQALSWLITLLLTALIGAIAIRSVMALAQNSYFPPPPPKTTAHESGHPR
ncbi:hypothetical protein AB0B66_33090 [Catellatospora sp. NPDC049111]|jgi:tellurite resistance protein|uniref:SLAC1 family transporter n=1 Tax=Catellatospora sp. NPDC049111 TaxID=3155271 RepID=UPI00340EEDD0